MNSANIALPPATMIAFPISKNCVRSGDCKNFPISAKNVTCESTRSIHPNVQLFSV